MHYPSSYSTAHYRPCDIEHITTNCHLKTLHLNNLELCQFHNRTNIGSNQPYKMQGVEISNHLILTKLGINLKNSGQIWNHKLGINFNYSWQTLNRWGVLMGGWGVQQHPRRNPDWKKKTPHTDQERVSLTSELCVENIAIMFCGLFCYLGLCASHCNVVGRLDMLERRVLSMILDYYCQSSCLISYFGQDLKAVAVIEWAINETESLVLIESRCFM